MELVANLPADDGAELAFWGKLAFASSKEGFRVIDISEPANPVVLADVDCPFGDALDNDILVWDNLIFLSVDAILKEPTCDAFFAVRPSDPNAFEGIRIIDVSDLRNPQLVTGVSTDCGAHNATLVPDPAQNRVLLYVSSASWFGGGPACGSQTGEDPMHGKISIIEVPLDSPADARVIAEPKIQVPPLDLSYVGGNRTVGCHDITVFLELHLAAAACGSEAQLWDISDPSKPNTLGATHITNPSHLHPTTSPEGAVLFWHSAAFTWDGKYVVFGDEYQDLGGCHHVTAPLAGRLWIYEVANPASPVSSFNIPREQREDEYCTPHLFNFVPLVDRYLLVSLWTGGGVDVIDFTDPANPTEIAYYDSQTPAEAQVASAYWYNGFIYANGYIRGVDVFQFSDPAIRDALELPHLNPQTQEALFP